MHCELVNIWTTFSMAIGTCSNTVRAVLFTGTQVGCTGRLHLHRMTFSISSSATGWSVMIGMSSSSLILQRHSHGSSSLELNVLQRTACKWLFITWDFAACSVGGNLWGLNCERLSVIILQYILYRNKVSVSSCFLPYTATSNNRPAAIASFKFERLSCKTLLSPTYCVPWHSFTLHLCHLLLFDFLSINSLIQYPPFHGTE